MQNTLLFRITLFATSIIILTGIAVGFTLQKIYEETLIQKELSWMANVSMVQGFYITDKVERLKSDILFLKDLPSIKRIIKIRTDAKELLSPFVHKIAHQHLVDDFILLLKYQPNYRQIRLIGLEDQGREIVRVEQKNNGDIKIISAPALQQKLSRNYVQKALTLPEGKPYLSPINLNRENGLITLPQEPTMRASLPVYDSNGEVFAVLVINMSFQPVLDDVKNSVSSEFRSYLVNDSGQFLLHPESQNNFSFETGGKKNILDQLPELSSIFSRKTPASHVTHQTSHKEDGSHWVFRKQQQLHHFHKVRFDSDHPERFLGVWIERSSSDFSAHSVLLRNQSFAGVFIIILFGTLSAYFFTRRITAPLEELTHKIRTASGGKAPVLFSKNATVEVRSLVSAFTEMFQKVQKHTQDLEENEERLRLIMDNLPIAVMFLDTEERYSFANKEHAAIVDYDSDKICGAHIKEIIGEVNYNYVHPYLQLVLSGEDVIFEMESQSSEGAIQYLELSAVCNKVKGVVTGAIILIDDATRRKRMRQQMVIAKEEAEQSSRAKSEFLMNMSHEIRTPLNAIVGFSQILMDSQEELNLDEEYQKYISSMKTAGENLSELINNILDLAKIEAGKMGVSEEDLNLKQLVQGIYHINKAQALKKNLRYTFDIDSALPEFIYSDRSKLNQILMNLVGNSIKFTPAEKKLSLSAKLKEGNLLLEVIDEGIGIPETRLQNIFDAFEQADGSTTRRFGGTGLGLAITKEMVELLKGKISVKSQEGQGASFYVELPIKAAKSKSIQKTSAARLLPTFSSENVVLAVEDNELNQMMLKALFKRVGIAIHFANNGEQGVHKAVELKKQGRLDLIIMDMHMPVMDGLDAMKELKTIAICADVPVVAFSADAFTDQHKKTLQQGFVAYLTKPMSFEKLHPILDKYLQASTPEASAQTQSSSMELPREERKQLEKHLTTIVETSIFQTDKLLELMDDIRKLCQNFNTPYSEFVVPLENAIFDADEEELTRCVDAARNSLDEQG